MTVFFTAIFGLIPINFLKIFFLRTIGHEISYQARLGFSILLVNRLELDKEARISSFNLIRINHLKLKENSFIGRLNVIYGPMDLRLDTSAGISKRNKIRRAYAPISYGKAMLSLGYNSFIVSNHFLDLTKSVKIGENSIIAGIGSQLWTHGYYHADNGNERIRIDGEIQIGNNVYIGSSCIFNPGVKVSNSINIGAGSTISKNLENPGMYVSQKLRFFENNLEKIKSKLSKVKDYDVVENVYTKDV